MNCTLYDDTLSMVQITSSFSPGDNITAFWQRGNGRSAMRNSPELHGICSVIYQRQHNEQ
ncbi:MAG: hypothetical protein ACLR4Z_05380 [Butyricicoccaceae bacterium]